MNRRLAIRMAAVMLGLATASAAPAHPVDAGNPHCNDATGKPAFCNIGPALASAQAGTVILIAPGHYTGPQNRLIDLDRAVSLQGAGSTATVIDLEGQGYFIDFQVLPGGKPPRLSLSGLAVHNGPQSGAAVRTSNGELVLERVLMSGHPAGAISMTAGTLLVDESEFRNNSAELGGAIHLSAFLFNQPPEAHPRARIRNSTFHGNQAGQGGALRFDVSSNTDTGDFQVINSTFSGNSAERGGAILANDQVGLRLAFVTFAANQAKFGGALSLNNTINQISHTVLAGMKGLCEFRPDFQGQSLGWNLAEDSTCDFYLDDPSDRSGLASRLGPLADNGGPTPTHAPLADSPLIGTGLAVCLDFDGIELGRDQRGFLRPMGPRCDLGSVESPYTPQQIPNPVSVPALGRSGLALLLVLVMLAAWRGLPGEPGSRQRKGWGASE